MDKNIIHLNLKSNLDSVRMTYEKNFDENLNLIPDLRKEIDNYLDFVESKIIEQMEWE